MDIPTILGRTEADIKAYLFLLQSENADATREELLFKNFERLVSWAVLSGIHTYHNELRKQLLEIRHVDIGDFNLFT